MTFTYTFDDEGNRLTKFRQSPASAYNDFTGKEKVSGTRSAIREKVPTTFQPATIYPSVVLGYSRGAGCLQ